MSNILCVDIGNTNIVLAIMQGESMLANVRIPSKPMLSDDEYHNAIQNLISASILETVDIDGSIISSVVPRLSNPLQKACKGFFSKNNFVVDYTLPLELNIKYEDPSEVGADRICNAVGAFKRFKAPLIVVDMGTATTFDLVSINYEYLGGVIMPGLETAGRDLFERAAKLPKVNFDFPKKIIGKNTAESMQSGLMWGTIDQIDGLIERVKKEWKQNEVSVIATGGLSEIITPHSRYIQEANKSLTLLGMVDIFEEIRSQA